MQKLIDGEIDCRQAVALNPLLLARYKSLEDNLASFKAAALPPGKPLSDFTFAFGINNLSYTHTWTGEYKQRQLCLFGPSNSGKSRAIDALVTAGYTCFPAPDNNDWHGFHPVAMSFVWFDDFRGNVPPRVFLQLLEGRPIRLNVKGGGIQLPKPIPIIISTTLDPTKWFKDIKMEEIYNRIQVVELEGVYPNTTIKIW